MSMVVPGGSAVFVLPRKWRDAGGWSNLVFMIVLAAALSWWGVREALA